MRQLPQPGDHSRPLPLWKVSLSVSTTGDVKLYEMLI